MCVCAQATPMPPNGTGMELLPWPISPIAACSKFHRTLRSSVVLSNLIISILNVGWLSFYCRTPQERSIAMA